LRTGKLYRSDALQYMTEADVRIVRDELGVRLVVDLRSSAEVSSEGIGALPTPPVEYRHLPLFDGHRNAGETEDPPPSLADQYFHLLRTARGPISKVLRVLAHSAEPAVFHCAAGKDRTGIISAILLGLVGVRERDVVEDYVFTNRNLDKIIERLRRTPSYQVVLEHLPPSTLHAKPETMTCLLERIAHQYGSMLGYARSAGVDDATLAGIQRILLEDL
jgi:protein tyrosine/serine phosphatase